MNVDPAGAVRVFVIDSDADSRLPNLDQVLSEKVAALTPSQSSTADIAVLLYTSGTTSDPKGVMLTHGNLSAEADAVFKTIRVTPDDALLGVLPLFHALAQMGFHIIVHAPYGAGRQTATHLRGWRRVPHAGEQIETRPRV